MLVAPASCRNVAARNGGGSQEGGQSLSLRQTQKPVGCKPHRKFAAANRYPSNMSTVKEIESAITQLKPREIHAVADWLLEYRERLWDKKIAADAHAGKLDSLIKKARAGNRAGKATTYP
jgi:hypothetical protein